MISAVHKKTGDIYKAFDVWKEIEDPHKEEWYCCSLHKYEVTPIIKHERIINDEKIYVVSHFRILGDHWCEGESDEHWNLKIDTSEKIKNNELKLFIRNDEVKEDFIEEENYVEKTRENNRADILFELKKPNTLLGKGVVIEIKISEDIDSLLKKTVQWIKRGYSITWISDYPNKKIDIKYPFGLYRDIVKWCNDVEWNWKVVKERGAFGEN